MDSATEEEQRRLDEKAMKREIILFAVTFIFVFILYKIFGKKTGLGLSIVLFLIALIFSMGFIVGFPGFIIGVILSNFYLYRY